MRVITPALAQQQDISKIPTTERRLPEDVTIQQIRQIVARHLRLQINETVLSDEAQHCHCRSVPAILSSTTSKLARPEVSAVAKGELSFLLVEPGRVINKLVSKLSNDSSLITSATAFLRQKHGQDALERQVLHVQGWRTTDGFPIVTLCSITCASATGGGSGASVSSPGSLRLDVHTAETPISTPASYLTFKDAGLQDMLMHNSVLNLYATVRKTESSLASSSSFGRGAIFKKGAHWEPDSSAPQSERGMALFLSTLRVVCNVLEEADNKKQSQDTFLKVFHQIANFPPAVRAMHILLHNSTPSNAECAAISQAVFHSLQKHMPMRIIKFDKSRLFETSRLFFGLLLEKVKHVCRANPGDATEAYLSSFKTVELTDAKTQQCIMNPVDTNIGLLERGFYNALKSGVLTLSDKNTDDILHELELDGRTNRATLLTGGLRPRVIAFDMNILYSRGARPPQPGDEIIASHELDFSHLSVLCSRNGLTVIAPARLATSSDPVLTLDGSGLAAVYCGREACGKPGSDFMIHRPTQGGDKTIDPAVVTQLIAPILRLRAADGTAVLDAPGDAAQRKIESPDEILMVCVDCSASMSESAGFRDMVEEDHRPLPQRTLLQQLDLEDKVRFSIHSRPRLPIMANLRVAQIAALVTPLDDVKDWIENHESFDDVLRIIQQVDEYAQRTVAKKLITAMSEHAGSRLRHTKDASNNRDQYTQWWRNDAVHEQNRSEIEAMEKFIANLHHHQTAIADWLMYRSRMLDDEPEWEWYAGQPVPGMAIPTVFASDELRLSIPDEYLCAISHELLSDPVSTADGHIYDRQAIRQWFTINNTSPKTGLALAHTSLSTEHKIAKDIEEWIDGDGFLHSGRDSLKVSFSSRLGTFDRKLRADITCAELYQVVFQALRGCHSRFRLQFRGQTSTIAPVDTSATGHGLVDHCTISIVLPEFALGDTLTPTSATATQALVKVYGPDKQFVFSYWVPKSTTVTITSVLYKYWRKVVSSWGLASHTKSLVTWTNMLDNGDGHSVGHVRETYEKLRTFLTPEHASGSFEDEDVFDKPGLPSRGNVLKVYIASGPSSSRRLQTSRMDVLKQMFDQFVNRTIAYNYNTHIGLIKFNTDATVERALTDVVEDFRATVNGLNPKKDTAIWDGLKLATDQIVTYAARYPNAKKRILCITDGEDTKSSADVVSVADGLFRNDIVVDCMALGEEDHAKLLAVSHLTGGFKFVPKSLSQAMAICELEPVLSLSDRQDVVSRYSLRGSAVSRFNSALDNAEPEVVNSDVFPKRRPHPNMADDVIELVAAKRIASSTRAGSMLRNSRLLAEIQGIIANPHPAYDVHVSEADISFFKVVMQGPEGSPYANGTFLLYLDLNKSWPSFAPEARLVTPIHHPSVNANGRICHSLFDRNWTSDTTCVDILNNLYGLLLSPDYNDPV